MGIVLAFSEVEMENTNQMKQTTLKHNISWQIPQHLWYHEKKTDRQNTKAYVFSLHIH